MKDFENSFSETNVYENELSKLRNPSDKDINDNGMKKSDDPSIVKSIRENKYLKFFSNLKQSANTKNEENKKQYTYSRLPFSLSKSDNDLKDLNINIESTKDNNNVKMENFQCDHINKQKCKDGVFSCSENMSDVDHQKCAMHLKLERKESLGVDKDFYGHYGFTNKPQAVNLGSCDVKDCDKRYRSAIIADDQSKPDHKDSKK